MKNRFQHPLGIGLAVLLVICLITPVQAQPARLLVPPSCVWTGLSTITSNWSAAANWTSESGSGCPQLSSGTPVALAFPGGAQRKTTSNNNMANAQVISIGFDGPGYNLSGNPITLVPDPEPYDGIGSGAASGSNTLEMNIVLSGNIRVAVQNILAGIILNGNISGNYSITKAGSGTLELGGANGFSGGITINAGKVALTQNQAGGSGMLTVADGATLATTSPVTALGNPLSLSGAGLGSQGAIHSESPTLSLNGPVTLANANTTIQSTAGSTLTLANAISGGGSSITLTLDGPAFTFSGSQPNIFTGTLYLPSGQLTLNRTPGVQVVPGKLIIGNGSTGGEVYTNAENQFNSSSQVTINKYSILWMNGFSQALGGISAFNWPCGIYFGGDQNTTLTFNTTLGPQNYIYCDMTGTGKLLVLGNGMQGFTDSFFTGSLEAFGGAAAYLDNFNLVGAYYLHPGSGGGFLDSNIANNGSHVGNVLVDNAYFAVSMNDLDAQIQTNSLLMNGTGTTAVFEFLTTQSIGPRVTGPVSLGNATLYVCYFPDNYPGLGTLQQKQRTLIENNIPGAPVSGTFNGKPEGSQVSLTGCMGSTDPSVPMRITYQGGDGNDVVVQRLVESTMAVEVFPVPSSSNQAVTLLASLTSSNNPAGDTPTQKVAFYDGSVLLGEAVFAGMGAQLSGVKFGAGVHHVQARLVGDPNFADVTSPTINFSVNGSIYLPMVRR